MCVVGGGLVVVVVVHDGGGVSDRYLYRESNNDLRTKPTGQMYEYRPIAH